MQLKNAFFPTLKESPKDASIISHQLMIRAGLIKQQTSGQYAWLPLGLKVLQNISTIIRREMDAADCQEMCLPMLQPIELWQETERENAYGKELLKMQDRHGRELVFAPTAEEAITDVFRSYVKSYKQLPQCWYQLHWKFRDEIRPRFGVMRGREFLMKDAYSFDVSYDAAKERYEQMFYAYLKTFKALGVQAVPVKADPGQIGGDLSHEFHVVADTGESGLFYDKALDNGNLTLEKLQQLYARSDDLHNSETCPVAPADLRQRRGIEVGHIFYLGDKYSKAMNAMINTPEGNIAPHMGCFGIGVSRLVGAIIEASHDEHGIIWPKAVAPYDKAIVCLHMRDDKAVALAEQLYQQSLENGESVLLDNRDVSPGAKLADMKLVGIPEQIIISGKNTERGVMEHYNRADNTTEEIAVA